MAQEAQRVDGDTYYATRRFTCGSADAIEKGALLRLVDPRTASGASLINVPLAGIAIEEKDSADGSTSIGVCYDGVFEMYCSGAVGLGQQVIADYGNYVRGAATAALASGAMILGYALEAGSDAEVINVRVRL